MAVRNMSEIRQNMKAIAETRQITNAMYLLSTSRVKRAMTKIAYNEMYMNRIRSAVKAILSFAPDLNNRYLQHASGKRAAYLIIASDKGLCGSYNYGVVDCALSHIQEHSTVPFIETVGLSATELLRHRGLSCSREWIARDKTSVSFARHVGEEFLDMFNQGRVDEVYVVYTHYDNRMSQSVRCERLLPIRPSNFATTPDEFIYPPDAIFVPSVEEAFEEVVPQFVVGMIDGCIEHAAASEHSARMNAMQSATDNADDMLRNLNFQFNTARQFSITNEISEISSAAEIIGKNSN